MSERKRVDCNRHERGRERERGRNKSEPGVKGSKTWERGIVQFSNGKEKSWRKTEREKVRKRRNKERESIRKKERRNEERKLTEKNSNQRVHFFQMRKKLVGKKKR